MLLPDAVSLSRYEPEGSIPDAINRVAPLFRTVSDRVAAEEMRVASAKSVSAAAPRKVVKTRTAYRRLDSGSF